MVKPELVRIPERFAKSIGELDFATVARVLGGGMHNMSSDTQNEADSFVLDNGLKLKDVPHVFMATHSMGGREWKVITGRKPGYISEGCFNGGWYIFTDEDVDYLHCSSATSGSSLTAEKLSDGSWNVTLEVPSDGGQPYQGFYWDCFHKALGLE